MAPCSLTLVSNTGFHPQALFTPPREPRNEARLLYNLACWNNYDAHRQMKPLSVTDNAIIAGTAKLESANIFL